MSGVVVHEWIEKHGGAERVLDAMLDLYPDADLRCLWNDAPGRYPGRSVSESWLARTPLRHRKSMALPFMPAAWASTDLSGYDWALVSSHLFAHHVGSAMRDIPNRFVYVHSPARYIWAPELDARGQHPVARAVSPALRRIDKARAADGAHFAANSRFVRDRIRTSWDQDAAVIYPPVRVSRLQAVESWRETLSAADEAILAALPEDFVLGASRFVGYKRLDVVIAAGQAAGLPVVIAGSGPDRAALEDMAGDSSVPVHIIEAPSDELLFALFQQAVVYVFPATEDFGIMPVESMALGTPVVVYSEGGARESVDLLGGGVVVEEFTPSALREAVRAASAIDMDHARVAASEQFGEPAFRRRVLGWMTPSAFSIDDANDTRSGDFAYRAS